MKFSSLCLTVLCALPTVAVFGGEFIAKETGPTVQITESKFAGYSYEGTRPTGPDIDYLESLLKTTTQPDYYSQKPAANIVYTNITKATVELIVQRNLAGYERFFISLFGINEKGNSLETLFDENWKVIADSKSILQGIDIPAPLGSNMYDYANYYDSSIAGDLLRSSFGTQSDEYYYDSKIESLRQIIENAKWNSPRQKYPSLKRLKKMDIWYNGEQIKVAAMIDEFIYTTDGSTYTLKYKNDSYTREEAEKMLAENPTPAKTIDYQALLQGKTVPDLSQYVGLPADAGIIRVENPRFFWEFLTKSPTKGATLFSSFSTKEKDFFAELFGIDKLENTLKEATKPYTIALLDINFVQPDLVIQVASEDATLFDKTGFVRYEEGGKIWFASSREAWDDYQKRGTTKSLHMSDDFRYTMTEKSNLAKGIFIFFGDDFFERMTSFENYNETQTSLEILPILNKLETRHYAWRSFRKTTPLPSDLLIDTDTESVSDIEIKNNQIYYRGCSLHSHRCSINTKSYDRKTVDQYRAFFQNYQEEWRSGLDPLSIIVNPSGEGIKVDFAMMPLPQDIGYSLSSDVSALRGVAADSLDLPYNPKIDLGLAGVLFSMDFEKLEKKSLEEENAQTWDLTGMQEFEKEVLKGQKLKDFLGNEIFVSVYDTPFPSATDERGGGYLQGMTIGIEMKDFEQGQKFQKLILQAIKKDSGATRLRKEVYRNTTIEGLKGDFYFVDHIYSTVVGNILFLGFEKETLKHHIDTYLDGTATNTRTSKDIPAGTMLYAWLDGKRLNTLENIPYSIKILSDELSSGQSRSGNQIIQTIQNWYTAKERAKLDNTPIPVFVPIDLGWIRVYQEQDSLMMQVDRDTVGLPRNEESSEVIYDTNATEAHESLKFISELYSGGSSLKLNLDTIFSSLQFEDDSVGIVFEVYPANND